MKQVLFERKMAGAELKELRKNFDGQPGEEQAAQSPLLEPVEGLLLPVPLCTDSGVGFRKMEGDPSQKGANMERRQLSCAV